MFTVKIKYKDKLYAYPKDTSMLEISSNMEKDYQYKIIIGSVNNKIVDLNHQVDRDCEVNFYDLSYIDGNRAYERGLLFLYIKAVKEVLKSSVLIEHSIDRGIYTEIVTKEKLTEEDLKLVENKMQELVNLKIPFEKLSILRLDAISYYETNQQLDKAENLKYISNTYVNLYKFKEMYDYFYGEMPIDSSYLDNFKLTLVEPKGIVLRYPNLFIKNKIADYVPREKLFTEFRDYHCWCRKIGVSNATDLNKYISLGKIGDLIYLSEIDQSRRLLKIVKEINEREKIKVVLIAGPSSSGKTTTSKKLALYLKSFGKNPYSLSIDDYFYDREKTPKKPNGEYDFESTEAVNRDLFNDHLKRLLNCEEVLIPTYNFITGKSEDKNKCLKLEENDILIIEGLHALNEQFSASIPRENKYKIYLSPLTSLNLDNHNRISTTDNRLLRRIIRDNRTRGYNASKTLGSWLRVRVGEEKYVFPYQEEADVVFNTSLVYELGVLRLYTEPLLFSVKEDDPNYGEALRLINLLRNILPITSSKIPLDSILREFIGDSYFKE
ncbi:MAG: nucleoside kinase [Bacilli bacterium]|jgi:uridine kinase